MLHEYANIDNEIDIAMANYTNQYANDNGWDRQCLNQGEFLGLIGRRIVHQLDNGSFEYERFKTPQEAEKEFEDREFPDEYANIISEGYTRDGKYGVTCNGRFIGEFESRDEAELALARQMVADGEFGDSWFIGERGNYWRIDDDIRAYHDEGGDKMRADLQEKVTN